MTEERTVQKTEEEWKEILGPERYRVLREKGTEKAFSGKYWNHTEDGTYVCAACGSPLFKSDAKFDSRCGWPSFYEALDPTKVEEVPDYSFGIQRTEVVCRNCGGHLGHVFDDSPETPTGLRYCINSAAIEFTG